MRIRHLLAVGLCLGAGWTALPAQANIDVECERNSGPTGVSRDFMYKVHVTGSSFLTDLYAGQGVAGLGLGQITNVGAWDNQGNPLAGWSGSWSDKTFDTALPFTAHGSVSPAPNGTSIGSEYWSGPGIGTPDVYWFGFDSPSPYANVGWSTQASGAPNEDWSQNVCNGKGPAYGVVPEPGTLALVAMGSVALLRRRRPA